MLSPRDTTEWQLPQDPQMAPDGRRVAFTVQQSARPDEHDRSAIWLLHVESGESRRFTHGPRADSKPRWSPDGSQIAFLSDREEAGTNQLYAMWVDGGEARLLAKRKGGISDFSWSRDGSRIACVGKDPKTEDEEQRVKDRRDHVVRDADLRYGRLYVVDSKGGDIVLLGPEGKAHVVSFDWTPEGDIIAAQVASPLLDDEFEGPAEIVRYNVNGERGTTSLLYLDMGLSNLIVSPDGYSIAYRAKERRVNAHDQIWVAGVTGGEARLLTAGYEGTIECAIWSTGSRELLFVSFEDLWGAIRAVKCDDASLRYVLPDAQQRCGSYDAYFSQSSDGSRFAVVQQSSTQPPEVWTGAQGEELRPGSRLNQRLAALPYSRAEPLSWTSDEGVEIHGLLFKPVGFADGVTYPLVVHVHGGPAWLWSDRFLADWHDWAQLLAQRDYAVLLPNPRGSTGRGVEFLEANVNDLGGGEFRDMMKGVDHVLSLGFVDPDRMGIGGWSWGGYMTAWTVTQTDRFKCAVMGAGLSNLASDQGQNDVPRMNDDYFDVSAYEDASSYLAVSAVTHIKKAKTPTLIVHGEADERVRIPQAWEMYRGLKWAGVETVLVSYPREEHPIKEAAHQIDLLERVLAWFERFLKPHG